MIKWSRVRLPAREVQVGDEVETRLGFRPVKRIVKYSSNGVAFRVEDIPVMLLLKDRDVVTVDTSRPA